MYENVKHFKVIKQHLPVQNRSGRGGAREQNKTQKTSQNINFVPPEKNPHISSEILLSKEGRSLD